jgi:hypothetical protein
VGVAPSQMDAGADRLTRQTDAKVDTLINDLGGINPRPSAEQLLPYLVPVDENWPRRWHMVYQG